MPETDREAGDTPRDSRTQLANRDAFYRDMSPLIRGTAPEELDMAMLVVDVDGVDFALQTFGPFHRDTLVGDVAARLKAATAGHAIPYHIMQGRFALVRHGINYLQATEEARAVVAAFQEAFEVNGAPYRLAVQTGISHFPNHADTLSEWVRTAVFAAHQARVNRSGYAVYDRQWDQRERERFRLMVDLGGALASQQQIQLAYQPKIDLRSGECTGAEALCRWQHPQQGLVPPGHFLPFVEQSDLLLPLTEATVAEGLGSLSRWRQCGFDGDLALNLSPSLFRHPDLKERLLAHFHYQNVDPANVDFEVTETGIMEEPNKGIHTLSEIRNWGCPISVDDFGTGHSSLAYLADLPVDALKIDKHFVQGLAQPWGEAIVGAAVTLAQKLGLHTIAEGIETKEQLQKCRELGCDIGQGFYTARPMFRADFEQWLGLA
jgi:predicted signal transduction protein with EAL and GGDEF domain